jgi:hypothetical protein
MDFNWKINALPSLRYNSRMSEKRKKINWKWAGAAIVAIIALVVMTFGNGLTSILSNYGKGDGSKILYYSLTCSYCKNVSEYIKNNEITGILEKEISVDQANANELYERMVQCGEDVSDGLHIPVLWAEGKCFVGETEAIDYLKTINSGNEQAESVN